MDRTNQTILSQNDFNQSSSQTKTRTQEISQGIANLRSQLPLKVHKLSQPNVLKWTSYYIKYLQSQTAGIDNVDGKFMEWLLNTYADTTFDLNSDWLSCRFNTMGNVVTFNTQISNLRDVYELLRTNTHHAITFLDHEYTSLNNRLVPWLKGPEDVLREYQVRKMSLIMSMGQNYQQQITDSAVQTIISDDLMSTSHNTQ